LLVASGIHRLAANGYGKSGERRAKNRVDG
jgi:hypothetical protein